MSVAIQQAWLYSIEDIPPIGDKALEWQLKQKFTGRVKIFLALMGTAVLVAVAQQRPDLSSLRSGSRRYELFSSDVAYQQSGGNTSAIHEVFLLDTQDGRVWRYQPTGPVGGGFASEQFAAIPVSNTTGVQVDFPRKQ